MNLIEVAGRLGADPETRFTASGQKVTTLRIACRSRKGSQEDTIWWRATLWGDRFDKLLTYLKKGSAVIILGEMHKPEIFTGKDGSPQVSLELTAEIVRFSPFGGGKGESSDQQQDAQIGELVASGVTSGKGAHNHPVEEDDIPF